MELRFNTGRSRRAIVLIEIQAVIINCVITYAQYIIIINGKRNPPKSAMFLHLIRDLGAKTTCVREHERERNE